MESEGEFVDAEGSCSSPTHSPSVKRKASPKERSKIKRQNSLPNLRQTASQKRHSDMLVAAFEQQSFREQVAPVLIDLLKPVVEHALSDMNKSIMELINSNKSLQATVERQFTVIEQQRQTIDTQNKTIADQDENISQLNASVEELQSKFDNLSLAHNDLEQYGRRNSLRVSNMVFNSNALTSEDTLTQHMVSFINKSILKSPQQIKLEDVERCHTVTRGVKPQILIKFKSYQQRAMVFHAKRNLKGNTNRVFITEDLTRRNYDLVKSLISLRRNETISDFWTFNGKIYMKTSKSSKPVVVRSHDDLP